MTICTELFRVSKSSKSNRKIADIFVRNFEDKVERRILGAGEDTLVLYSVADESERRKQAVQLVRII